MRKKVLLLLVLISLTLSAVAIDHQPVLAFRYNRRSLVALCWCGLWRGRPPQDDKTSTTVTSNPQPTQPPRRNNRDEPEEEPPPPPPVQRCTPTYAPPTITMASQDPPYPVVIGQDPEDVGVDVVIAVVGGVKTNGCNEGPPRDTIAAIDLIDVNLSTESRNWITGELAQKYPGARVLDNYPLHPAATRNGLGSTNASLRFHLAPRDPGTYLAQVRAVGTYGETNVQVFSIPVYLLDATITW